MQSFFRHALVLLSLLYTAGGCGQAVSVDSECTKLQGVWEVVSCETRGLKTTTDADVGVQYEFAGRQFRRRVGSNVGVWKKYELNVSTNPKQMDWSHTLIQADKTLLPYTEHTIYRIIGDELQICYLTCITPAKQRPVDFSLAQHDWLLTLRRVPFANDKDEQCREKAAERRTHRVAWQRLQPWVSVEFQGKYDVDFGGKDSTSWHSKSLANTSPFPGKIGEEQWHNLLLLHDIRLLSLRGCKGVGNEQMRHVSKLVTLESLDLHSTEVSDIGLLPLRELHNLTQLDLAFTAITDEGLSLVGRMLKLRRLLLQGTLVTEKGIDELRLARRDLDISWTRRYTDSQRGAAVSLSQLGLEIDDARDAVAKTLICRIVIPSCMTVRERIVATKDREKILGAVNNTAIVDSAVVAGYAARLPAPISLCATGENTDDSIFSCIRDIQGVVQLNLRGSRISDAGMAELKRHVDLKVLNISYSKDITDAGIANLAFLVNLEKLDLTGIELSSAALLPLLRLDRLKELSLSHVQPSRGVYDQFRRKGVKVKVR